MKWYIFFGAHPRRILDELWALDWTPCTVSVAAFEAPKGYQYGYSGSVLAKLSGELPGTSQEQLDGYAAAVAGLAGSWCARLEFGRECGPTQMGRLPFGDIDRCRDNPDDLVIVL